jgi:CheY-like chemotaxis protein
MRAIRQVQERMLHVLEELGSRLGGARAGPLAPVGEAGEAGASGDVLAFPPEPVRSRRRKKVLLIDDGRVDAEAAAKALKKADIPVRTASDAKAALAAIGEEKPDVIVLEPHLGGGAGAKEFVRALKANVEWAGIPVVLHAAGSTESLEEAKIQHGADEIVLKGPRGDEALVSQVITLFRRR